jgi:hypothetical protein
MSSLLIAILIAVGMYVWFSLHPFRPLKPATIEREVQAALPAGSTTAEIDAYLTEKGYAFSKPFPARENSLINMIASDVPPDAQVIWADVDRNTRWWFDIMKGQVYLFFVLDSQARLERLLVAEHLTGP